MERIPLAIVGCGGMGGRHLLGLKELYDSGLSNVELVAVCDLRRDNAEYLADNAGQLLGRRPLVFEDMEQMVVAVQGLQAASVTTDAGSHHIVAGAALGLGLHVLCEKPLALTMRGCNLILVAQQRSGKVLSVAENYRRDPMSRLTKALIDGGAMGRPYMYVDMSVSAGNRIVITPWRHVKNQGGMLIDGGVHNADMMLDYMGDAVQVYASVRLWERTRFKTEGGGVSGFYAHWHKEMPDSIEATADDTLMAVLYFASGTMGQWTQSYAGHGQGFGHRGVYGSIGSLRPGGTRNGRSPVLKLDGQDEITGDALLGLVPGFHLDEITARLFGAERMGSYDVTFPEADRKLLAIEYHELGECVLQGVQPEVDGQAGRRALALCYAAFESAVQDRPVTLDEVEAEEVGTYEADVNAHWKI
ncbi:MAG: Gfo/Idh/MocA family oxidoreductase [Anaerolineae bacterium]|nr:MAG: Gfo/Idh/MocA family oxidoreductase [Anaerolineae bacterium]